MLKKLAFIAVHLCIVGSTPSLGFTLAANRKQKGAGTVLRSTFIFSTACFPNIMQPHCQLVSATGQAALYISASVFENPNRLT